MERLAGGCHCGAVRYEVEVAARLVYECDCSICVKKGYLHLIVDKARFHLLQGAEALSEYTFNTHTAKHLFCARCGVQSFYIPRSHPQGVSVNARCLDFFTPTSFDVRPFGGRDWEKNIEQIQ
ncbi:GFA family protein [Myxococcota bacterium]|nr:GFA family protein [Myxococcota bacterium]MBU1433129.1 GFA family protein [Myxococcota bacterium]MBU1900727.1 GFA family protein [Myxococcota bacterium]